MKIVQVEFDRDKVIGQWQGMGGAITEAAAYNYLKLPEKRRKVFLDAYYSKAGLGYNWGRVAVGSCDFSLTEHEYKLARDKKYILPMLQDILARKDLRLIASPWSPPAYMKTNLQLREGGRLRKKYFEDYAKFLRKWLDDYAEEGVKVDYLVPQNEPAAAQKWESCKWSLRAQRKFIYDYLAPALAGTETKILGWDHNKKHLARVARFLLAHAPQATSDKVAGLAFHWYDGAHTKQMDKVRARYEDKLLISSEMCCGWSEYDEKKWKNDADLYAGEIFACINSGVTAWLDWNILLDAHGGPAQQDNQVKAPIILNEKKNDFILTPIYKRLYEIAHSIPVDCEILRCESDGVRTAVGRPRGVMAVATKKNDDPRVVIVNLGNEDAEIRINGKKAFQLAARELKSIKI